MANLTTAKRRRMLQKVSSLDADSAQEQMLLAGSHTFRTGLRTPEDLPNRGQHSLQMAQHKPKTDPKFNLNGTMRPLGLKF